MSVIRMESKHHSGKVVIVTGASSGIGRRIATHFAKEGAEVVCASPTNEVQQGERYDDDITMPTEEFIRSELDGDALFVSTDVGEPDEVSNLIDETIENCGQLDVLVNNAGIYIPGNSQELSLEEWEKQLSVDLDGTFYCSKYAIPPLKETEGSIINIASVNSTEGGIGPAYASAKAAVVNLTRDLAVELGQHGINVNSISPGFIKTPIQDYLDEEDIEMCREHTLLPRLGEPEDVAAVATFLASSDASFIHGADILVDGGWAAHRV